MKKYRFKAAALAAMVTGLFALSLTGCKTGGDTDSEDDPPTNTTVSVTGVSISPGEDASLAIGGAGLELTAEVTPSNATNKAVTWSLSEEGKVSLSATSGETVTVSPEATGTVTVTVTTTDGSFSDSVNITVTEPVKVSAVQILKDGVAAASALNLSYQGTLVFTADVSPLNTTIADRKVKWTSSDTEKVSLSVEPNDGVDPETEVTATWVAEGEAVITVTTVGTDSAGEAVTDTVTLTARGVPTIRLHNQKAESLDPETTDTLNINETNKRYTVSNAESTAKMPSNGNGQSVADMTDTTIVYYEDPIPGGDFSMSARVKITKFNDKASGDGSWEGAFIGILSNPTADPAAATTAFTGIRSIKTGDYGVVYSRYSSGEGTTIDNSSNTSGDTSVTDKRFSPKDCTYEYIYTVAREGTAYIYQMKHSKTGALLWQAAARSSGTETGNVVNYLAGPDVAHPAIVVVDCEVEISNVVITYAGTQVFASPVGPATAVNATAITLSAEGAKGGGDIDYIKEESQFPELGVQLSAAFEPENATDDITYSITAGENGTVDADGVVTISGIGQFTVTATSVQNETIKGTYVFNIIDQLPPVTSITLPSTYEMDVKEPGVVLQATVQNPGADETLYWHIETEAGATDSVSTDPIATIVEGTGIITAGSTPGVVKVVAVSYNGADGTQINSNACTLTVNALPASRSWNFKTLPVGWTDGTNNETHPNVYYRQGLTLLSSTRSMGITIDGDSEDEGATVGRLQPNGAGDVATIIDVQGPFSITAKYTSSEANRFYNVKIKDQTTPFGAGSPSGQSLVVGTVNYTGDDVVDVTINATGNARLYDLIIEPYTYEPVTGVALNVNEKNPLKINEGFVLEATVSPYNATEQTVNWTQTPGNGGEVTLSATSGASITVTGKTAGTVTVRAASAEEPDTNYAECVVTVVKVAVSSVTLDTNAISLAPGGSQQLVATVAPVDASDQTVEWESSNDAYATVVNGLVEAQQAGANQQVTITVKSVENNDLQDTCTVTITGTIDLTDLAFDPDTASVEVGKTLDLSEQLVFTPNNASDQSGTWQSADHTKVSVDSTTGVITGVAVTDDSPVNVTFIPTDNTHGASEVTCAVTVTVSNTIFEWTAGDMFTMPTASSISTSTSGTATGGAVTVVDGKSIILGSGAATINETGITTGGSGVRLIIGSTSLTETSTSIYDSSAEFDFSSRAVRITVTFQNGTNTSGKFQLYVNNNSTSDSKSVLGTASRPVSINAPGDNGQATVVFTINAQDAQRGDYYKDYDHVSLGTSFIMIRCDGSLSILITHILVEYIQED
jgi:uncharacterized protein YjdB